MYYMANTTVVLLQYFILTSFVLDLSLFISTSSRLNQIIQGILKQKGVEFVPCASALLVFFPHRFSIKLFASLGDDKMSL